MKKIIILLIVQSMLSGCGLIFLKNLNKSERDYDNNNDMKNAYNKSYVTCDTGDCPEHSAGLYSLSDGVKGTKMSACSGTLIGPDLVMTNAHCIPKAVKFIGASCKGRIKINFPETQGLSRERFECHSVVNMSDDTSEVGEPDWSIIKIAGKTQRRPVKLNRDGVADDSKVVLYKVDFDLYSNIASEGRILKTECIANTNHLFSDDNVGPISALMNISHCDNKVIKGNSGSGILNANQELIGVFSFGNLVLDSEESWATELRARHPFIKQNSGGGTNLACIPESVGGAVPELCYYNQYYYEKYATFYAKLREQSKSLDDRDFVRSEASNYYTKKWKEDFENINGVKSRFWYLKMRSSQDYLIDRFDVQFYGSRRALDELLFRESVKLKYPYLPACIVDGAPKEFTAEVVAATADLKHGRPRLNNYTFYQTRKNESAKESFTFIQQVDGSYAMTADKSLLDGSVNEITRITYQTIDYRVPTCD